MKQICFLIMSFPHDSDDGVSHLESLALSAFTSRTRLKCRNGTGLTFALTWKGWTTHRFRPHGTM